jgi:acyl-CoA synthetase (AMP-forming)/AMP-acid ligase II
VIPGGLADDCHLGRAFERVARTAERRPAIVTASASYMYGDLLRSADVVRERLRGDIGFRDGDRVVVWLPNGPEYVAAFYGTLLAGGVVVPVPPDIEAERLKYILEVCDARFLLTAESVVRRRRAPAESEPEKLSLAEGASRCSSSTAEDAPEIRSGTAPAAIFFTSGSTGEPKGVTLSHTNLLSNARSICEYLEVELHIDQHDLVNPWHAAASSAIAFTAGALLPLLAILLPPPEWRVPVTFVAVLVALAATGTVAAALGGAPRLRAAMRLVIGGALALAATWVIGTLLGTTVV